ncbi:MAG: ferredoxin [Desulfobacterales bacterium]|nr:ferredoxin [Desulfobacterales bacterium]
MAKRVVIDEEECMGCEACVEIAPDVFEFDDDAGKAYVSKAEGGDEGLIEEAMEACPAECITWEE